MVAANLLKVLQKVRFLSVLQSASKCLDIIRRVLSALDREKVAVFHGRTCYTMSLSQEQLQRCRAKACLTHEAKSKWISGQISRSRFPC